MCGMWRGGTRQTAVGVRTGRRRARRRVVLVDCLLQRLNGRRGQVRAGHLIQGFMGTGADNRLQANDDAQQYTQDALCPVRVGGP